MPSAYASWRCTPLVMPGVQVTEESQPILDYLVHAVYAINLDRLFPGFEAGSHGLRCDHDQRMKRHLVKCAFNGGKI